MGFTRHVFIFIGGASYFLVTHLLNLLYYLPQISSDEKEIDQQRMHYYGISYGLSLPLAIIVTLLIHYGEYIVSHRKYVTNLVGLSIMKVLFHLVVMKITVNEFKGVSADKKVQVMWGYDIIWNIFLAIHAMYVGIHMLCSKPKPTGYTVEL